MRSLRGPLLAASVLLFTHGGEAWADDGPTPAPAPGKELTREQRDARAKELFRSKKGNFRMQAIAEVIGENRSVFVKDGAFTDAFDSNAVHLYRIPD